MRFNFLQSWDDPNNHESDSNQEEVEWLIGQVRDLPGIKDQNYEGVPGAIKIFAELCLWGNTTIDVVKGIHQRWGYKDKETKELKGIDPHIRVQFRFTTGVGVQEYDMHVELSEKVAGQGQGRPTYCWSTVGVTQVRYQQTNEGRVPVGIQKWPAQFTQSVQHIQKNGPPRFRRRYSVGCFPPQTQGLGGQ